MARPSRISSAAAIAFAVAVISDVRAPGDASACMILGQKAAPEAPSIAVEQALILHDPAAGTEHFVRRIAFRKAKHPFGFVVPVPARPTVAKVDGDPFPALRRDYGMPEPADRSRGVSHGLLPPGTAIAAATAPVQVLSVEKIGSFTAFVLSADDAAGLATWLTSNGFDSPSSTRSWLDHYTKLHFYYVAMRFDPPAPAAKEAPAAEDVTAETVRISFASALPFYPYLEPTAAPANAKPRVLDVWLASPRRYRPVAVKSGALATPFFEGSPSTTDGTSLASDLGSWSAPLLTAMTTSAPFTVQMYEDQKTSRQGWGDVVFVPTVPDPDPKPLEARRALFPLLDPATAVLP